MLKYTISLLIAVLGYVEGIAQLGDNEYFMYVASHRDEHPAGVGLYTFNTQDGSLKFIRGFDQIDNAAYLALGKDGNNLFTITGKPSDGVITSFSINPANGDISFINQRSTLGRGPCYVYVDNSNNYLMNANYSNGNVSTFKIEEAGFIGAPVSNIFHNGSSVNKDRQNGPHPHMILQAPDANIVVVPDLGIDKVMVYELGEEGNLEPAYSPYIEAAPGAGPRHFAFHPTSKYGFVLNELNSTITSYSFDPEKGLMGEINTVSMLPEGFDEYNKSADIHVSPDGRYVFGSNRGHNSIAILEVNGENGTLSFIRTVDCGGEWPRAFVIDPSGKYMIVANKNSDNNVVFEIDYENGDLIKIGEDNQFPGTQCLKFLPK